MRLTPEDLAAVMAIVDPAHAHHIARGILASHSATPAALDALAALSPELSHDIDAYRAALRTGAPSALLLLALCARARGSGPTTPALIALLHLLSNPDIMPLAEHEASVLLASCDQGIRELTLRRLAAARR